MLHSLLITNTPIMYSFELTTLSSIFLMPFSLKFACCSFSHGMAWERSRACVEVNTRGMVAGREGEWSTSVEGYTSRISYGVRGRDGRRRWREKHL